MAHKEGQQLRLPRTEPHGTLAHVEHLGHGIERERTEFDALAGRLRRRPPELCPHPGFQLTRVSLRKFEARNGNTAV
jgi:hypothetical protein